MAIDENDPRLKDMLRAIELGDLPEDLPPDPEDYDDMGGIKSLDRGAPSIKMASEPEDEFELELGTVIKEYNDLKEQGLIRDISIEDYINMYLSRKKMMKDRATAMGGGMMRMGYAGGTEEIVEPSESMKKDTTTYPLGQGPQFDIEMIKKLIEKRKKEKKKLAMGGIAGVL